MKPSLTVLSWLVCLLGFAAAVVASATVATSTVAMTAPAISLFFHIAQSFRQAQRIDTGTLKSALTSPPLPCSSGGSVDRVHPIGPSAADALEFAHSPPPTINETISV